MDTAQNKIFLPAQLGAIPLAVPMLPFLAWLCHKQFSSIAIGVLVSFMALRIDGILHKNFYKLPGFRRVCITGSVLVAAATGVIEYQLFGSSLDFAILALAILLGWLMVGRKLFMTRVEWTMIPELLV